ncbi:hypothetical protein HK100_000348, partial [Physocladia obscura]
PEMLDLTDAFSLIGTAVVIRLAEEAGERGTKVTATVLRGILLAYDPVSFAAVLRDPLPPHSIRILFANAIASIEADTLDSSATLSRSDIVTILSLSHTTN